MLRFERLGVEHDRTGIAPLMTRHTLRDDLLAMFAEYTAHGFHGGNSLARRTILGPPRSLNDIFAELAR
jgi:hypothetical protein